QLHNELVDWTLERSYRGEDVGAALALLDALAEAITEVVVVGDTETEDRRLAEEEQKSGLRGSAKLTAAGPLLEAGGDAGSKETLAQERKVRRTGVAQHRVHFGRVAKVLQDLVNALPVKRIWLLLDEWSA